jgi:hypothetical protein
LGHRRIRETRGTQGWIAIYGRDVSVCEEGTVPHQEKQGPVMAGAMG